MPAYTWMRRIVAKTASYTHKAFTDAPATVWTNRGATGTITFTLPTPALSYKGFTWDYEVIADYTLIVSCATAGKIVAGANAAADNVSFAIAGRKVGGRIVVVCDGTSWHATGVGDGFCVNGTPVTGATPTEIDAVADISAIGAVLKVKKLAISATPTGAEQDTTFDLPAKAMLIDVFVEITTAEATGGTKTLDVGLLSSESGGDADGFLDGVSVATLGMVQGSLVAAGVTLGVLRKETVTDSGSATHSARKPHLSSAVTAKSITYTAGSNDFAEFRGAIYLVYAELG